MTLETRLQALITAIGSDIKALQSASGSANTAGRIAEGAALTLYNNPRTRDADSTVLASAPSITATLPGTATQSWAVDPSTDACVCLYAGGNAVQTGGGVWFPSVTYNVSTGQADLVWRAETECDGSVLVFGVTAWAGSGPRIMVDGVYYSLSGLANGTGIGAGAATIYIAVPFTTAKKRRVALEGRYDIKLVSVHTAGDSACTRPADIASARMVVLGDSNAAMYGYDTKGDSFAWVLADCLGLRDVQLSAVSGTGLQATNGGSNYNYVQRVTDVTGTPDVDLVLISLSWNDWAYGSGFSAAQIKSAAASLITTIRAAHAQAVILFHGIATWDIAPADEIGLDGHEGAVIEAVTESGDALVGFIPVRSAAASPIFYGGSTTPGTHAARYVNTALDHLGPDGNRYLGRWLADRVFQALVSMSGTDAPALLAPPTPSAASAPASYTQIDVVESTPTPPAADTVRIFSRSVGGRMMPAAMGPSGLDTVFQPHLGRNAVCWARPVGNGTAISVMGIAITATGTATGANVGTTNRHTRMKRIDYLVATAAATAVAGFRSSVAQFSIGAATPEDGGFHFICRFGPATGATLETRRGFVGMANTTAAPTDADPSTAMTNYVGVGHDAGDTNYQIMHRITTTVTKINTGIPKVCSADRTEVYELALFALPGPTQQVGYEFRRLTTGDRVTGVIASNLPAVTTLLAPRGWSSVGGTSSVIGIALMGLTIETDY
jgi:hypothetical protein